MPLNPAELIQSFLGSLPTQFKHLHSKILEELEPKLENWFLQLNLVTQQELDSQLKILKDAELTLIALKSELQALKNNET